MLGGIFHFYSNAYRKLCQQTMETLIRHCARPWRLIWVITIAYVPEKRTQVTYGLKCNYIAYLIRVA